MVDLFELVAAGLTDADSLAAEPCLEMADRLVLRDLRAGKPGAGRDPFAIVLATSFDQRSPQRLSVTLALSALETSRQISCARSVMRPCTSPVRNTVCAAPPLPAPR